MTRRTLGQIALVEALALLIFLSGIGALMYVSGAPNWIALVCVAAGSAMAVDLVLLSRSRRGSSPEPEASAEPAVAGETREPSAEALAARLSTGSDDGSTSATDDEVCEERLTLGYARVARDASGPELELHSQRIRAWCAENGLTLTTIVHDVESQSGDTGTHPALDWALEQIAAGAAQTLVTTTLRHLSPSVASLPPLLRWFTEPQRTLIAIDLRLDTGTEAGRLAAFALAGVGGWERERLSARTRRGLEAARARGAGRGRAAVADLPELRERIVRMREQGMTLQAIADALNEAGVPTLRGGAKWRPSSVQRAAGYRRPATQHQGVAPPNGDSPENGRQPAAGGAARPRA